MRKPVPFLMLAIWLGCLVAYAQTVTIDSPREVRIAEGTKLCDQADGLVAERKYAEALSLYRDVLKILPTSPRAKGGVAACEGKLKEAAAAPKAVVETPKPAPVAQAAPPAAPLAVPVAMASPTVQLGRRLLPPNPDDYEAYSMFGEMLDWTKSTVSQYKKLPEGNMLIVTAHGWDPGGQLEDGQLVTLVQELREIRCPVVLTLLKQTKLTTAGYAQLAGLPNVVALAVQQCATVDDEVLASFAKIPALRSLMLNECHKVTDVGVKRLAALQDLQYLNVAKCELVTSEGVKALSACPKLASLNLWGTQGFADVTALTGLTSLRALVMFSKLDSKTLPELGKLKKLQTLNMSGNNFERDYSFLAALPELETLTIADDHMLSDIGKSDLAGCRNLKSLSLPNCGGLTGSVAPLAALTQLESLSLSYCQEFTGEGLRELAVLPKLEALSITEASKVGSPALGEIAALTQLKSLNLWNCDLSDAGLAQLASLKGLQKVGLAGKAITDVTLQLLGGLPALEEVSLRDTIEVTDAGLLALAQAPAMKRVAIRYSKVTPAGIGAAKAAKPGLVTEVIAP
ncbi:MAG: hypothetical protein ABFE08_16415 [Armatimonadia bacterium]